MIKRVIHFVTSQQKEKVEAMCGEIISGTPCENLKQDICPKCLNANLIKQPATPIHCVEVWYCTAPSRVSV
jgi:hypothetical protein